MKLLGKYNDLGGISARGVGNIHSIDGIVDKYVYNDILKKNIKVSAIKMGMPNVYKFHRTTIANTLLS